MRLACTRVVRVCVRVQRDPTLNSAVKGAQIHEEAVMPRRRKISRQKSRRSFTRASGTHKKNVRGRPMRGGIRL